MPVSLLIGQDNPWVLIPIEVRQGKMMEPYGIKCCLGWLINGPVGGDIDSDHKPSICNTVDACVLKDEMNYVCGESEKAPMYTSDTEMSIHSKLTSTLAPEPVQSQRINYRGRITLTSCWVFDLNACRL